MSKAELLKELTKLSREEREDVRKAIEVIDSKEWLDKDFTEEQKIELNEAVAEFEKNPDTGLTLEAVLEQLEATVERIRARRRNEDS